MSELKPLALVTGGSRGIGAAIVKRLAQDGFHVLINYSSNEAKAKEVLDEVHASGGSGELCGFNIADSAQVTEKLSSLQKEKGPIEVLVNNAGIAIDGLLIRVKDEDIEKTLSVDLKGTIFCTREVVKKMMRAKKGSIINISSVIGECGNAGQSIYAAAKSGLLGFSKATAKELASRNIRVNVITPGFIQTDMTEVLTDAQKEEILRSIPMESLGKPEDIASMVAFLASSESRYITGQVIGVNGGMYM